MKAQIATAWLAALALPAAINLAFAEEQSKATLKNDAPFVVPASPASPPPPAAPVPVSLWLNELVKMAKSGVDPDVMLTFIASAGTFNLGADQIIYLRDLGVPSEVVTAIIRHDVEVGSSGQGTPPAIRITTPALPILKEKQEVPSKVIRSDSISIITSLYTSPGETIIAPAYDLAIGEEPELSCWAFPPAPAPPEPPKLSPVREPHPVKLNDPIVMYRAATPWPNMVVIRRFP